MAFANPFWSFLALFGPFWPFLALFGPFWPFLALFGPFYKNEQFQLSKIWQQALGNSCGLHFKNMTIVNDDIKRHHNLESHTRVINYPPRLMNYAPRKQL
jgi:hypothetical protein